MVGRQRLPAPQHGAGGADFANARQQARRGEALREPLERIRVGRSSTGGYNTAEDGIWANADVHAKAQAEGAGQDQLAELLNDIELLPEFLADESDRMGEFIEMLHSMARVLPSCQYMVEEFERVSTGSA